MSFNIATRAECEAIEAEAEAEIAAAIDYAAAGTNPPVSTLLQNVYTT